MKKLLHNIVSSIRLIAICSFVVSISVFGHTKDHVIHPHYVQNNNEFDFDLWDAACRKLTSINGEKADILKQHPLAVTVSIKELTRVINEFIDNMGDDFLGSRDISEQVSCLDVDGQLNKLLDKKTLAFTPFVQKSVMTCDNGYMYVCGDVHGDIHALNLYFRKLINQGIIDKNLKITQKYSNRVSFVFTGDYVDCAQYCAEVLYLLATFKNQNRSQVICIRGNHESQESNENRSVSFYVFSQELEAKYGSGLDVDALKKVIYKAYEYMPVAVYVGVINKAKDRVDYAIYSHASLDFGYNPECLLKSSEAKYSFIPKHLLRSDMFSRMSEFFEQILCEQGYEHIQQIIAASQLFVQEKGEQLNSWKCLDDIGFTKGDFRVEPEVFSVNYNDSINCYFTNLIKIDDTYWRIGAVGHVLLKALLRYFNEKCLDKPNDENVCSRLCISVSAHQHVSNIISMRVDGSREIREAAMFAKLLMQNDGIVRLWSPELALNMSHNAVWPEEFVKVWSVTPNQDFFNKSIDGHVWQNAAIAKLNVNDEGYENWTIETMLMSSAEIYS